MGKNKNSTCFSSWLNEPNMKDRLFLIFIRKRRRNSSLSSFFYSQFLTQFACIHPQNSVVHYPQSFVCGKILTLPLSIPYYCLSIKPSASLDFSIEESHFPATSLDYNSNYEAMVFEEIIPHLNKIARLHLVHNRRKIGWLFADASVTRSQQEIYFLNIMRGRRLIESPRAQDLERLEKIKERIPLSEIISIHSIER
jgi:hypothetical protein